MQAPSVNKETFITLATISCTNFILSTHDGTYQQIDSLAMESPPAPPLSNIWLSKYEPAIKNDILRIKESLIENKISEINSLHRNFKFALEVKQNGKLPFLDICIEHHENTLSSTWYCKPTDTELNLNFHAMAPKRYKHSVIQGFVYRIYRDCCLWEKFHESLIKAKDILERNQYPPNFYEPIISATIEKTVKTCIGKVNNDDPNNENLLAKVNLIIQYRGLPTDNFIKQL